jgi:hypothetical protein
MSIVLVAAVAMSLWSSFTEEFTISGSWNGFSCAEAMPQVECRELMMPAPTFGSAGVMLFHYRFTLHNLPLNHAKIYYSVSSTVAQCARQWSVCVLFWSPTSH